MTANVIETIMPVSVDIAYQAISQWHYSRVMPKITHECYGGFIDNVLSGIITFGYGVRPIHTIQKLFPSLTSADYWEIGKMAFLDDLPKNTESNFIARVLKIIKRQFPERKIIYTWADGMLGKPGYVYQASNFLYGGYIWTDCYFDNDGERIHPRQSAAMLSKFKDNTRKARPSHHQLEQLGIKHYYGKQFRYAYFLCGEKEKKRLIQESTVKWTLDHPKHSDLQWKIWTEDGIKYCEPPEFDASKSKYSKYRPVSQAIQGALL